MTIDFSRAQFLMGAPTLGQLSGDYGVEVAFAGRSNAGKSSCLNKLTGQHQLARVSKTPGRTQMINLFGLDPHRRLVDLPGYGYAEVSQELRAQWHQALAEYLQHRQSLTGVVILMDIRHPFTEPDLMLIEFAEAANLKLHIVLTKADKLKFGARKTAFLKAQRDCAPFPNRSVQLFSTTENIGIDELQRKLNEWLAKTIVE
jgi:GTP-binding protein